METRHASSLELSAHLTTQETFEKCEGMIILSLWSVTAAFGISNRQALHFTARKLVRTFKSLQLVRRINITFRRTVKSSKCKNATHFSLQWWLMDHCHLSGDMWYTLVNLCISIASATNTTRTNCVFNNC
jgi:hypothetical protein